MLEGTTRKLVYVVIATLFHCCIDDNGKNWETIFKRQATKRGLFQQCVVIVK